MAKTEKAASTEVAVAATSSVAVVNDQALSFLSAEDFGGAGFEGADKDSFAIPFLQILQKMSPKVDEDNAQYIKGAKAGMILNTVTNRLFDGKEGFDIVPCYYKRSFILWGQRDAGGGFKGEFTPEVVEQMIEHGQITVKDGVYYKTPEDGSAVDDKKTDYFADTRAHYVITIDPASGETGSAILSLASSQIKPSKMLMTALQQKKIDTPNGKRTPPMFLNKVRVTTIGQQNDSGSWSGIVFTLNGLVTEKDLFEEAKAFYTSVSSGAVKADYSKAPTSDGPGASDKPKEADGF
jgi:hypothetical protein